MEKADYKTDYKTETDFRHVEEVPERRRSSVVAIPEHTSKPVWEQRQTYGPAGIRGVFTSRYVLAAAAFATLGGTLFGYE